MRSGYFSAWQEGRGALAWPPSLARGPQGRGLKDPRPCLYFGRGEGEDRGTVGVGVARLSFDARLRLGLAFAGSEIAMQMIG